MAIVLGRKYLSQIIGAHDGKPVVQLIDPCGEQEYAPKMIASAHDGQLVVVGRPCANSISIGTKYMGLIVGAHDGKPVVHISCAPCSCEIVVTICVSAENCDGESPYPALGANVTVTGPEGYAETLAVDETGCVSFLLTESGTYNWSIEAFGYTDASGTLENLECGDEEEIAVTLEIADDFSCSGCLDCEAPWPDTLYLTNDFGTVTLNRDPATGKWIGTQTWTTTAAKKIGGVPGCPFPCSAWDFEECDVTITWQLNPCFLEAAINWAVATYCSGDVNNWRVVPLCNGYESSSCFPLDVYPCYDIDYYYDHPNPINCLPETTSGTYSLVVCQCNFNPTIPPRVCAQTLFTVNYTLSV